MAKVTGSYLIAKTLKEEGACIKTFKLVQGEEFQEEKIKSILQKAGARSLSDNISDKGI